MIRVATATAQLMCCSERDGDIADLLAGRREERFGLWPVDLSGCSGAPAAGSGCPARQPVVDRPDRGNLEMCPNDLQLRELLGLAIRGVVSYA